MTKRIRILLLVPHLGGGGAERVVAQLARSLSSERFEVHLGLLTQKVALPERLPLSVEIHGIGARRVLFGWLGVVRMVRRVRPALILSTMFHLNFLVLLLRPLFPSGTRILVRQNGMISSSLPNPPSRMALLLYRSTYPRADGIICQTAAMEAEMRRLLGSDATIHVLRNPVDAQGIRNKVARSPSRWSGCGPHLLAIGRLSPEKGFDLLLDAFAVVRKQFPSADLAILGVGIEEAVLKSRCIAVGLAGCVLFAGYEPAPSSWFAGATALVVPSRQEAFPNVLLEGAAAGLPIVVTPCSQSVAELLHGQPGVWIARELSSEALALSIKAALDTLTVGVRFCHCWLQPFELRPAVGKYEELILETINGHSV